MSTGFLRAQENTSAPANPDSKAAALFHSTPTLGATSSSETTNAPTTIPPEPTPTETPAFSSTPAEPPPESIAPSNNVVLPTPAPSVATTPDVAAPNPAPSITPSNTLIPRQDDSKVTNTGITDPSLAAPPVSKNDFGKNTPFFKEDLTTKNKTHEVPASAQALMQAGEKVKSGVVAKGAPRLTLDECVKTALQKNPAVLTAIDTIRQQSGNFITVRSAIIPHLGVDNSYKWVEPSLGNTTGFAGLPSNEFPINQAWGVTLGGSQLLYNGGTAIANIKAAKFSEQMAYYNLRVTIDSVIAQVVAAFYQVVLNRALVVANQQSVELLASQVEDQKSRYEAGTVPRFNVLQAEVQLANAQPALITARNNLRIALFQLVQLIGMNYPNLQSVEVPFEVVGDLEYHPRKVDSDKSIYTGLQRSPTLKAQRQNILMMAQNITAAIGGYLPTITANAGYQFLSVDSASSVGGTTIYNHDLGNFVSGWFFGVQGNWAIFDGLATYGNVKQAKANLMIAKTAYDNGVRQVILSVQQAISNMQQAQETVDSQKANVVQAAEALRLSQERLNAGAGVQLDVLNAQVQLLQAQTTVLQAEYNYIAATAQYDQALSLNTQYEELFDDPMNHRERGRYKNLNSSKTPQPLLPRALRATDPLPAAFTTSQSSSKSSSSSKNSKSAPAFQAASPQ